MPEICRFYGIVIRMFYNDHNPPHFHVIYQENEALVDIKTLEILEGQLPSRAKSLMIEWAMEHRHELITNWQKAKNYETLDKIEPLYEKLENMISIKKLKVLDNKHIHFTFSNDAEKTINFAPFIGDDILSKPLADPSYFRKVALYEHGRGIYWPNDYDFCPDFLRQYQAEDKKVR